MSHYQSSMSLTKKVQEYLEKTEYIGETNLQQAAEHFFCSEQSLIRGLKQEGARFKDIREKCGNNEIKGTKNNPENKVYKLKSLKTNKTLVLKIYIDI